MLGKVQVIVQGFSTSERDHGATAPGSLGVVGTLRGGWAVLGCGHRVVPLG